MVTEKAAARIKQDTGIDISGYTRTLTAEAVQHALEMHGVGGVRLRQFPNQLQLLPRDIELLPRILNDPDAVTLSGTKGPNGEDRIISRKKIENAYIVVEEARPKKGLKKLTMITMWKEKSETPQSTPETLLSPRQAGNVPELGDNIPQTDAGNNNKINLNTGTAHGNEDGSLLNCIIHAILASG
jgi:hypothetical protein